MIKANLYMGQLEDKVYQANKKQLELLTQLRDTEKQTETLKSYMIDLKARVAIYIPVKGDPIDNTLAEFINSYPDR